MLPQIKKLLNDPCSSSKKKQNEKELVAINGFVSVVKRFFGQYKTEKQRDFRKKTSKSLQSHI